MIVEELRWATPPVAKGECHQRLRGLNPCMLTLTHDSFLALKSMALQAVLPLEGKESERQGLNLQRLGGLRILHRLVPQVVVWLLVRGRLVAASGHSLKGVPPRTAHPKAPRRRPQEAVQGAQAGPVLFAIRCRLDCLLLCHCLKAHTPVRLPFNVCCCCCCCCCRSSCSCSRLLECEAAICHDSRRSSDHGVHLLAHALHSRAVEYADLCLCTLILAQLRVRPALLEGARGSASSLGAAGAGSAAGCPASPASAGLASGSCSLRTAACTAHWHPVGRIQHSSQQPSSFEMPFPPQVHRAEHSQRSIKEHAHGGGSV